MENASPKKKRNHTRGKKNKNGKTDDAKVITTAKNISDHDQQSKLFPDHLTSEVINSLSDYGVLVTSIIRINNKFAGEAYVTCPSHGPDIFIENIHDRNRALEGDEVYVLIKPAKLKEKQTSELTATSNGQQVIRRPVALKERQSPSGVVVGIKKFNNPRLCIGNLASYYNKDKGFGRLIPTDLKLPALRIPEKLLPPGFCARPLAFQESLFSSKIVQWNNISYAIGGKLDYLGESGTAEAETKAILARFDIDAAKIPDEFNKYFPSSIPPAAFTNRADFRKECIFTIDPLTARDLDDAVSCTVHPDGSATVGVHIADVSYFLNEGTPLDDAVAQRATTTYLVDKVYHMLPIDLCGLCSLTPGQDKLAFSVVWELAADGSITKQRFVRSIIHSCAQFSYEQVQDILDEKSTTFPQIHGDFTEEAIVSSIKGLHRLAEELRAKRYEAGALRIDQTKISFSLDPKSREPVAFFTQEQLPAHRLIEEFMLLANTSVAEEIQKFAPDLAFLRAHDPPIQNILQRLQIKFEAYGIPLEVSSSKALQTFLSRLNAGGSQERAQLTVINNALAKPMARALYYCGKFRPDAEGRHHYALSVPLYTHFTSPIRRYADIMVHRLLEACLNNAGPPKWEPEYVQSVAINCNVRKYNAKVAGDASTELYFALYVGSLGCLEVEAVVNFVGQKYCECIILVTGISTKVYFDKINGKVSVVEDSGENQAHVIWENGQKQIIDTFSVINIALTRGTGAKLDARLIQPNTT